MACCSTQWQGLRRCFGLGGGAVVQEQVYAACEVTESFNRRMADRSGTLSELDLTTLLLKSDPQRPFQKEYTLLKQLGVGAFGAVYKAKSNVTKEERAVKVVAKSEVQEDLAAIVIELEAMIQLSHPNVAAFYEYFEAKKCICVVMELCDGGDFHALFKSKAPILEVQFLFRDVLLAVAYCHDSGICHRDLKLENCLICKGPNRRIAKVIDFGLAAIRKTGQHAQWLEEALGTKYFVAPEVLDTKIRYGFKCDIWSVGVMLYIVLCNQHPFAAEAASLSNKKLFLHIASSPIRSEPLEKNQVPRGAVELLNKLLLRNVDKRPTAEEALSQDWLRPKGSRELSLDKAWGKNTTKQMLSRIDSYGQATDFEKVMRMLVVHRAKMSDVDQMRAAFVSLDTVCDGSLTQAELRKGIKQCGVQLTDREIEYLFENIDADHNHKINYYEWLSATMDSKMLEVESAMKDLFHFLDSDRSGTISLDEFRKIVNNDEAHSVMAKADTSQDGLVDWAEFQDLMHKMAHVSKQEAEAGMGKRPSMGNRRTP